VYPYGTVAVPELQGLCLSGCLPVWPADLEHHAIAVR
jgi:hypothetical protein